MSLDKQEWPFKTNPKPAARIVAPAEPFEPLACELAREVVRDLAAQYCAAWREPTDEPLTQPRVFDVKFQGDVPDIQEAPTSVARQIASDARLKVLFSKTIQLALEAHAMDAAFFFCEGWTLHGKPGDFENRNGRQIRDMPGRKECVFALIYVRRGIYRIEQAFENGQLSGEIDVTSPENGEIRGYLSGGVG